VNISGASGLAVTGGAGLSVTGPTSVGNLSASGNITAGGNITGSYVAASSSTGLITYGPLNFNHISNFAVGYGGGANITTGTGVFQLLFSGSVAYQWEGAGYRPMTDNNKYLGANSNRWSQLYAGTATINTSDENEKQDIRGLSEAELRVSRALKPLVCAYRWRDAVALKGEGARIHIGIVAQRVEEAFATEGLDARRYGLFCEDEIEEWAEPVFEGEGMTATIIADGYMRKTGRFRLGVRYEELLAFIIGGM
jgi:hypothetical protein